MNVISKDNEFCILMKLFEVVYWRCSLGVDSIFLCLFCSSEQQIVALINYVFFMVVDYIFQSCKFTNNTF